MKIDLHVHTKRFNKDEPESRNIDAKKFKKIMKEANVGIIAITNHNKFDYEEYKDFCDDNYILLPGVEINLKLDDNETRHLNIIFSPENAEKLSNILKEIKTSSENPVSLEELKENFDIEETIFYLDKKNSKKSFKSDQEYEIIKKLVKNGIVISDVNNVSIHQVLLANNYLSLIGSDVRDWDKYLENDAPKLLETNLKIESYLFFFKAIKKNPEILKMLFDKSCFEKYEISEIKFEKNEKIIIENLNLFKGINIIFGNKATGKTEILNSIYQNLEEKGEKVAKYLSGKHQEKYKDLLKNHEIDSNIEEKKDNIKKKINEILKEEDEKYLEFKNFWINENNNKSSIFKIKNCLFKNVSNPNNSDFKNASINLINFIKNIKSRSGYSEFILKIKKDIITKLWIDHINNEKEYRLSNLKEKIINEIKKLIFSNKNITSFPNIIGLFNKWKIRNNLIQKIEELKELYFSKEKTLNTYDILDDKKIKLIKRDYSIEFGKKMSEIENVKLKAEKYNKKFHKIFEIKIHDNSTKINKIKKDANEYFEKEKESFFSTNKKFYLNEKIYKPSNGEKAFILLMNILNNEEKKYILLDEPSTYLSSEMISDSLLIKLSELKKNKFIIIVTHKASLGINTIPINYIYRINPDIDSYKTYIGNFTSNNLININDKNDKKEFRKIILNSFEGNKEEWSYRKDIYENND